MKETLISNVISNLVDKIGVKNSNIVREVLVLEMKDIEIKERERQLVVYQDEITNAIKKFIAIKKLHGCTDRTLKAYLSELDLFFGKIKRNPKDISTDDIRLYLAMSRKTCSNTTLDNKRRYLNSFFDWCATEELITKNPVKRIEKIKTIKKVKEAFTDYEIEKMRNELVFRNERFVGKQEKHVKEMKLRNIAIFETLLSTGVRVMELVNMNTNQINFENGEVIVLGKGNKERIVYLNAKAKMSLTNYLNERLDNLDCLFVGYDPLTGEAQRLSASAVEQMTRKLGKKLGIEAHPHKFRRTTATTAVNKGMPIEQVQKMLGHSSLNTTQIYVNVQDNVVKDSHEKYFN